MAISGTKENRKTRYTKVALRDSLVELMTDKPIFSISITEICERADLSRSTFYMHYKDQYDLLKQIEDETLEKMHGLVDTKKDPAKHTTHDYLEILEKLLQYIADNKNSVHVLLGANGNPAFQKKFLSSCIEETKKFLPKNSEKTVDSIKYEYYYNFAVGGFFALVQTWIDKNINISVKELAKLMIQLFKGMGA
jgi:AcrR family transcriptional regulator